jgi:hypothetical protein
VTLARAAMLYASLSLAEGPILRVASFDLGTARPGRVLVIVHHLACDAASWPILLEDLATVYAQLERGEAIALPPKTTSYQAWARRLEGYAAAPERGRDRAYWRRECAETGARFRRERDGARRRRRGASRRRSSAGRRPSTCCVRPRRPGSPWRACC